jgi:IS605 OrfB family transposase
VKPELRPIANPFVAAAPAGVRVRARLRVSPQDEAVLRAVGTHLGSLAGRDLAARCGEGRLDAKGQAASRARRKRALTAASSSRWAGAITRTSEDQYRLAEQNLRAERSSLLARIRRIEARLPVPAGGKEDRTRGYAAPAERHAKTVRLQTLRIRLAHVERQLEAGAVSVVRGGKSLLRKRNNLAAAGLTEVQWRSQWESSRLFLTADGEKDKAWGNETIRWNPDAGWLEIKLPAPLSRLTNQPHGRYRLSCPVGFSYRGDEVAAQAATGAVRYDISHDPGRGRWYVDASWKAAPAPAESLDELRQHPVVAIDVNHGHLAVAIIAPDGNILGTPETIGLDLSGLPSATRDGHLRTAISRLLDSARHHGARAIVIEDLDFAAARAEGRERAGSRTSRGSRGRSFRRAVAGIPTARFRDRITQMASNVGLSVIVIDPAYTSRWAAQHWLRPLQEHHPQTTGHHAAALVIGRRGLGHRARRRVTGNQPAPAEAVRPAQTRPGTTPAAGNAPRKPATPRGHRQPPGTKTGRPHRTTAGNQAAHNRSGPPATQDYHVLLAHEERCSKLPDDDHTSRDRLRTTPAGEPAGPGLAGP